MPGAMMKGAMNRKRILSLISTALLLVIVFAVPVSAVIYREYPENFIDNFCETLQMGNGWVIFEFWRGPMDGAYVTMSVEEGCTGGRTFVAIYCHGYEIRTASSHEVEGAQISCGADLMEQPFTTKTNFYAAKEYDGTSMIRDYYYVASNHNINEYRNIVPSANTE